MTGIPDDGRHWRLVTDCGPFATLVAVIYVTRDALEASGREVLRVRNITHDMVCGEREVLKSLFSHADRLTECPWHALAALAPAARAGPAGRSVPGWARR